MRRRCYEKQATENHTVNLKVVWWLVEYSALGQNQNFAIASKYICNEG
jgi:hypothetical protein